MVTELNMTPAFPTNAKTFFQGMTLRDYFAAQALPTCISMGQNRDGFWDETAVAVAAYAAADAMIEARKDRTNG
jgi:hypothetical protein